MHWVFSKSGRGGTRVQLLYSADVRQGRVAPWVGQMLFGIRLCIEAVFTAAPGGVARKKNARYSRDCFQQVQKFASLLNPSGRIASLSNRIPSRWWQSSWGGRGTDGWRSPSAENIRNSSWTVSGGKKKELSQQYHYESFLFPFFVFFFSLLQLMPH